MINIQNEEEAPVPVLRCWTRPAPNSNKYNCLIYGRAMVNCWAYCAGHIDGVPVAYKYVVKMGRYALASAPPSHDSLTLYERRGNSNRNRGRQARVSISRSIALMEIVKKPFCWIPRMYFLQTLHLRRSSFLKTFWPLFIRCGILSLEYHTQLAVEPQVTDN